MLFNLSQKVMAVCLSAAVMLSLTGCSTSQQTIATLVSVVGNSVTNLLPLIGNTNPNLKSKLQADFAQASSQILAWKKGDTTQNIVNILNIVDQDLSLIPVSVQTQALIALSIGTVESIIALLPQSAGAKLTAKAPMNNAPKNAAQFKKQWNAIVASNPALATAKQ